MIAIDTRIRDSAVEFLLNSVDNNLLQAGILHGQLRFRNTTDAFSLEWQGAIGPAKETSLVASAKIDVPALDEPLREVVVEGVESQDARAIPFEMGSHWVRDLWLESADEVAASLFRPRSRVKDDETLAFQLDQLLRYGRCERNTVAPLAVMLAYKAVEGHAPGSSLILAGEVLQDVLDHIELLEPDKENRQDREQIRLSATTALVHILLFKGAHSEIESLIDRTLGSFRFSSKANPFHHGENRARLLLLKAAIYVQRGDRASAAEYAIQAHYAVQQALIYLKPIPDLYLVSRNMLDIVECALGNLKIKSVCDHFLRIRNPTREAKKRIRTQLGVYLKGHRTSVSAGIQGS